jgi:hypothetical protein
MSELSSSPIQEGVDDSSVLDDPTFEPDEIEQEEEEPETAMSFEEEVNEEEKVETSSPTEWKLRTEVTEAEIGRFRRSNTTLKLFSHHVNKIRDDTQGSNYELIASLMLKLLEKDAYCHLFEELRRMYEFIIHIHNKYSVKLNKDISDEVDCATSQMMESAFRKYTEHAVYVVNISLTRLLCF